jgi:predicted enzyme related to lactoylglutathione lyase
MNIQIAYITVLVRDQDEALRFYTEKLGMEKREEDTSTDSRWLTVAPPGQKEVAFTLRQATGADLARVGDQTGTDRLCILLTDDCRQAYETLRSRGVEFVLPPVERPFGVIADCKDLYGNVLGLWEPR